MPINNSSCLWLLRKLRLLSLGRNLILNLSRLSRGRVGVGRVGEGRRGRWACVGREGRAWSAFLAVIKYCMVHMSSEFFSAVHSFVPLLSQTDKLSHRLRPPRLWCLAAPASAPWAPSSAGCPRRCPPSPRPRCRSRWSTSWGLRGEKKFFTSLHSSSKVPLTLHLVLFQADFFLQSRIIQTLGCPMKTLKVVTIFSSLIPVAMVELILLL